MPLTPIPGNSRLRAFQLGIETVFKTQVPATRRMPWAFAPTVDPHWTFTTADTGTLDQAIAPYRTAEDVTGQATGQLFSNDVPTIMSAGIMGGLSLTGGGAAKTMTASPTSTSPDPFDTYTGEWYDDATGDAWAGVGGVIETIQLDYPQDQGPIAATLDWRFAKPIYVATPTAALQVDQAPVPLFMADTEFYVNDSFGAIETTKLSDIAYNAQVKITNNLDPKRFANGSNTRFEIENYGRGERVIEFMLNGAKQSAWIAEAVKWIGANPTERFFGLKTTATVNAQSGTPHSLDIRIPGYWLTRADGTVNTNTAFSLTAHQIIDQTAGYPIHVVSVSTRTAL